MLLQTLPWLRCPACSGELLLQNAKRKKSSDVIFGTLACKACEATYPILAGVAVLVKDVEGYLQYHAKGVSALVRDSEIPLAYRPAFLQAKAEIETGHTEEDLESQRINALYFMNHYLSAAKAKSAPWWRPKNEAYSPEIDYLVKNFWDRGPFAKIVEWSAPLKNQNAIELGCGVGGLAQALAKNVASYLGVDMAFASIALARHIYLNAPYSLPIQIPQDLYLGPLTGKIDPPFQKRNNVDFVVGELENAPVAKAKFDLAIVLNAIDMVEDPAALPRTQHELLKSDGVAIHGCPYIWHKTIAERLRKSLPKKIQSSAAAVEYLYEKSGFGILKRENHLPWLFLKHFRQIEMYSVHLFAARKLAKKTG